MKERKDGRKEGGIQHPLCWRDEVRNEEEAGRRRLSVNQGEGP